MSAISYENNDVQNRFHQAVDAAVNLAVKDPSAAPELAKALKTAEGFDSVLGDANGVETMNPEALRARVSDWLKTHAGSTTDRLLRRKKHVTGERAHNVVNFLVRIRSEQAQKTEAKRAEAAYESYWSGLIEAAKKLDEPGVVLPTPKEVAGIAERLSDPQALPGLGREGLGPRRALFSTGDVSPQVEALIVHAWATRQHSSELQRVPLEQRGITVADQLTYLREKHGKDIFAVAEASIDVATFGQDMRPGRNRALQEGHHIDPKHHSDTNYFTWKKSQGEVTLKLSGVNDNYDYYSARALQFHETQPRILITTGGDTKYASEHLSIETLRYVRELVKGVVDSPRPARPASAFVQTYETDLQLFDAAQHALGIADKVIEEATTKRQGVIDEIVRTLCAMPKSHL